MDLVICVKIAHALKAEVTVLSHPLKKQEDAKIMGVDKFYATSDPKTFDSLVGYLSNNKYYFSQS